MLECMGDGPEWIAAQVFPKGDNQVLHVLIALVKDPELDIREVAVCGFPLVGLLWKC